MKQRLREYWLARSPRDRRIIGGIAALIAISVVYAYLWMPMIEARTRLRAELPKLRGATAEMAAQEQEIKRLKAAPASASQAVSPELINQSAERAGIKDNLTQVTSLSAERVQVTLNSVAFDRWIGWTRALATESALRVESAQVTGAGDAGTVKVQAVLALPGH